MLRDTQALLYFDWFARVDALRKDYLLLRSTLWHGYLAWSTIMRQHRNIHGPIPLSNNIRDGLRNLPLARQRLAPNTINAPHDNLWQGYRF